MQNKEIESFFSRDVKDYSEAVVLLQKYAGGTRAAFYAKANPRYYTEQVLAILRRLGQTTVAKADTPADRCRKAVASTATAKYPADIVRSKAKLHELWLSLCNFHARLLAMGDSNAEDICKARVALMAERQPYIEAFEELYTLQQNYFAEGFVRPELPALLSKLEGKIDEKAQPVSDFSALDDVALVKKRNSVRTQISKWQNMLRFQQKSPAAELNPMPDGPKRKQIEADIKRRQLELAQLNDIIQQRGL